MFRQITEAMYPFSAHQSEVKRMPQANSKVYLDRPWNGRANKTYFRDHQKDLEESWSIWTVIRIVRACWSHGSTDFSTFMTWPFKGMLLQRGGISSWISSIQPYQSIMGSLGDDVHFAGRPATFAKAAIAACRPYKGLIKGWFYH